jgi:hypothetical protein
MIWNEALPAVLGKMWLAFLARRFGGTWGTSAFGGGETTPSPYHGQSWPVQAYVIGFVGSLVGSKLVNRFWPGRGYHFHRGAVENMLTRLLWTEGFARSPFMQTAFGRVPMHSVADVPSGTRWALTPQGWVSMMGLTPARPLDGLTPARPLDGLAAARGIDMKSGGIGGRRYLGHALPESAQEREMAAFSRSGFKNPYQAVYSFQGR